MVSAISSGRPARTINYAMLGMIAGGLIMTAALGVRQTFGLFIGPFSYDHGLPVTVIAFAIALHNLVWGFAQPFAGAAADRYGAAPVVAFGAIVFAIGLAVAGVSSSGVMLVLSLGVLVGIGVSCTAYGVIMPAVGRAASPEKRSMAMGLVSAAGSVGQVLLVPVAQCRRGARLERRQIDAELVEARGNTEPFARAAHDHFVQRLRIIGAAVDRQVGDVDLGHAARLPSLPIPAGAEMEITPAR